MKGSVKHLFREFQNSLGDRRREYKEVPQDRRESPHSRLHKIVHETRERSKFLPDELALLRGFLCELLSEESCAEWLGFNDLSRPDTLSPSRLLASLVREPDWTDAENIHKLRMYRAAAFVDCLRPDALDWETPRIPDMEWVLEFIEAFTRRGISVVEQTNLIEDASRPQVSLETIVQTTRGPRLQLSPADLRYIWETRNLSHEERAIAWDNRNPQPLHLFDRPNVEVFRDKKLWQRWRVAVNYQISKAKALYEREEQS
jgi:hypothetical protein